MSVQALSNASRVRPGNHVGYAVWVWSTHGTSKGVAVSVRIAFARHVNQPRFTVCPGSGGSTCSIGSLPAGRADELQARTWVSRQATGGEQVQLTATASGDNASSYDASGTVEVVTAPKSPTDPPTTAPPPTTGTVPPVTLPPVPGTGSVTPPAGLFPTISPSPGSSSGSSLGFPNAKKPHRTRIATAASVVPLDPRLIGGQLAGLLVLGGAIVIAIARLSLRKPRPQQGASSQDK